MLAVEATGNSRYFVKQIGGLVKQVHMVNPSQFRVMKDSVKRTNKNDSKLLSFFLSRGLVMEVRCKKMCMPS